MCDARSTSLSKSIATQRPLAPHNARAENDRQNCQSVATLAVPTHIAGFLGVHKPADVSPEAVQGVRRITFDEFLSALFLIADKRGERLEETVDQVLTAGGPTVKCVTADYVKFHDDKVIFGFTSQPNSLRSLSVAPEASMCSGFPSWGQSIVLAVSVSGSSFSDEGIQRSQGSGCQSRA